MLNHYRLKKLKKRQDKEFLNKLHKKYQFLFDLEKEERCRETFPEWHPNKHFHEEVMIGELKTIRKRLEQILAEMKFPISEEDK